MAVKKHHEHRLKKIIKAIHLVFTRWKSGQKRKMCSSTLILKEAFHFVLKLTYKSFCDMKLTEVIKQNNG